MATISSIPSNFRIVLQKGKPIPLPLPGIEGGFAPPTPNELYCITRSGQPDSTKFTTSAQKREHGTPHLSPPLEKELELTDSDHLEKISKIQELIRGIPTQYPGAQDIYGRNISILYLTGESAAAESHLSGLAAGRDIRHPTEEEKKKFETAVDLIKSLAGLKDDSA